MIDAHIHFHKQPYTFEIIDKMVEVAISRGVDELWLLDHTHKFFEFSFLYEVGIRHKKTWEWYSNIKKISIKEFLNFINDVKKKTYPITLKFGLEVCYFHETEDLFREVIKKYPFDFLVGSVHYVNGMAYDIDESFWDGLDINEVYQEYYQEVEKLIKSQIFISLGHPDAIKRFEFYPSYDLKPTYEIIAKELVKNNMFTENNSGFLRYKFPYLGLNKEIYEVFKKYNVKMNKASDAHEYQNIGGHFEELDI